MSPFYNEPTSVREAVKKIQNYSQKVQRFTKAALERKSEMRRESPQATPGGCQSQTVGS